MRYLGTWFSDGLGSAGLTVGLNGFRRLFQPKQLHNSMIPRLDMPTTREFGGKAVQKSARTGRRPQMSCSGNYLSKNQCQGSWAWCPACWDSPLNAQGWQRAGSIFLSEYPLIS